MNVITLILAASLAASASSAETAGEAAHPFRVTNERGTAVIFTAPRTAVSSYIANRHRLLDRLAMQSPDIIVEAQVSFSRHLTSSQLLRELDGAGVQITTLNFGWDGQSGGFDLREGESLQAELARLHRYHGEFINEMEESRELIKEETRRPDHRPEDKSRYERHLDHVEELSSSYNTHGVLFIGARIQAPTSTLRALRDQAVNVRLVDPLWDELSDASGLPDVHKIAVPLAPGAE